MILDIDPVPKPRMTRADAWKKRPAVERYWTFKANLSNLYLGKVPNELSIVFNVPMPKSWSKKQKELMEGKPHQSKPDIDNYLKAFLDSLCEDDSYVYDVHSRKFWAYEGSIEVTDPD